MNRRRLAFGLLGVLLVACSLAAIWLYGRLVPVIAAEQACRVPGSGYRCEPVGLFELSVYRGQPPAGAASTPVLLLHGGPGFSSLPLVPHFRFLEQQHALFAYDQRGSGYSQSRADLAHYHYPSLVEEVEAVRRKVIGSERVILVGHSFGAYLALSYAARYPAHVERLVLVSAPLPEVTLGSLVSVLKQGVPPADPIRANERWNAALPAFFADTFHAPENRSQLASGSASYAVMLAVSQSLMNSLLTPEQYLQVQQPALLIHGIQEAPPSAPDRQARLSTLLPHARRVPMTESGHWAFIEQPAAFQAAVQAFLE